MSNPKNIFIVTAIALIGLFFGGAYLYNSSEADKLTEAIEEDAGALVRSYSPTIGSDMARVTLVEFLDPECESCRRFHPLVKKILKKYEGSIKYVVRYAPFHGDSKFAIKILEAARNQGKYWETLDLLFEKLPEWGNHHKPQPELIWTYLPELGLDIEKIKVEMKDPKIADMIEQEIQDGAKFRVKGTPSFFVNGTPLKKFGYEYLLEAVESEMQ